jgi:hypothetical protein
MPASFRDRPAGSEYASFYHGYVERVPEGDVLAIMRASGDELRLATTGIDESRGGHRYADGKWTVREVLGHMIDAERIFAYRALRIARGDATPLPGFDENAYVRTAGADARTVASLVQEQGAVRDASVQLFASFPDEAWMRRGTASGAEISVRALAYILAGHGLHHLRILRERYGVGAELPLP